jgi:hypothetical protein
MTRGGSKKKERYHEKQIVRISFDDVVGGRKL